MNSITPILTTITLFVCFGCGPAESAPIHQDATLAIYQNRYNSIFGRQANLPLYLNRDNHKHVDKHGIETVVECQYSVYDSGYRINNNITAFNFYFKDYTDMEKEQVMFHELGHCDLGLDHNDIMLKDKCPASIMSSHAIGEKCYLKHYNEYISEFKAIISGEHTGSTTTPGGIYPEYPALSKSQDLAINAIIIASIRTGVEPTLLKAICFTESSLNASAINKSDRGGASVGLCQIKLTTARLSGYRGTLEGLYNPYINAYHSARYIQKQLKRYSGNTKKAIMAYNAGTYRPSYSLKYYNKVMQAYEDFK